MCQHAVPALRHWGCAPSKKSSTIPHTNTKYPTYFLMRGSAQEGDTKAVGVLGGLGLTRVHVRKCLCRTRREGGESHVGCGLQGVLRGATVKSHGGHQCLWCDTHHGRGDGHDGQREREPAVEPSGCRLTAEQARNGHTVHFARDVVASRGVLSETDR